MKKLLNKITDLLADAALLEMGVNAVTPVAKKRTMSEAIEENLVEVAFAEAADFDDIHKAILREHESERDIAHPDEGRYVDNDMCFRRAA